MTGKSETLSWKNSNTNFQICWIKNRK